MREGSPEAFMRNMDNFSTITWGKLNNVIKGICDGLFQQVIRDTPVRYGWTSNSWFFSTDLPSNKKIPETLDGKKVHYDKTKQSKRTEVHNQITRAKAMTSKGIHKRNYYLTNNSYPTPLLEYGLYPGPNKFSKQAPGGFIRKNLQKYANQTYDKYAVYTKGAEG